MDSHDKKTNLILGETTFLSVGVVFAMITGSYFIFSIDSKADLVKQKTVQIEKRLDTLEGEIQGQQQAIQQNVIIINSQLGEVKGKLDLLINEFKRSK